jgi:hypothetical protein
MYSPTPWSSTLIRRSLGEGNYIFEFKHTFDVIKKRAASYLQKPLQQELAYCVAIILTMAYLPLLNFLA